MDWIGSATRVWTVSPLIRDAVEAGEAAYGIQVVGMADGDAHPFAVDEKWFVAHMMPGPIFVPLPEAAGGAVGTRTFADSATLADVLFFADCISYDHDVPSIVQPIKAPGTAPYRPIASTGKGDTAEKYYESLFEAYDVAFHLRFASGPQLRYEEDGDSDLTRFTSRFARTAEPLSLYAMSLRQVDFLMEYLSLYRVLEWVHKDNGKLFVSNNLHLIQTYDFGLLQTSVLANLGREDGPVSVFDSYRKRALDRINKAGPDPSQVARHLYRIRNSLAHGKEDFRAGYAGPDTEEVAADIPLLRLLARLAIETS
jgi:hypothetical protein